MKKVLPFICLLAGSAFFFFGVTSIATAQTDEQTQCENAGGFFDPITITCQKDFSYDKLECSRLGGAWDDTSNTCGPKPDSSYDRLECSRLQGIWNATTNQCLPTSDSSYEKKECTRKGLVWDSTLNKCREDTSYAQVECSRLKGTWDPLVEECKYGATGATQVGTGPTSNTLSTGTNPLMGFISLIRNVTERLIPILVTLAVLAFFWFLVIFIWKGADNPDERKKGTKGMGWAILAIFVMVSIWGIIQFIGSTTGIRQGGTIHGFIAPGKTK